MYGKEPQYIVRNPRHNEAISPVPWHFVKFQGSTVILTFTFNWPKLTISVTIAWT